MHPKFHFAALLGLFLTALYLTASDGGGEIVLKENQVDRSATGGQWTSAAEGDFVAWKEQIRTGELSRAALALSSGGVLRLSEYTRLTLEPPAPRQTSNGRIDLVEGAAYFFSRSEKEADVETPTASLNIRGTEFVVEVDAAGATTVSLFDGEVLVSNSFGSLDLFSGEQAVIDPGQAPRKSPMLDFSDRIQVFLYYPAIADPAEVTTLASGPWADSYTAYRAGDLLGAVERLPSTTPSSKVEFRYRAAVKLAAGQVEAAEADLLRGNPYPLADALRLLIATVKEPSASGPIPSLDSASGQLARSYALQTRGKVSAALAAARAAVEASPEFGFAWARVAELEFGSGRNDRALDAVERALTHTPKNAQALSLRGYLKLSQSKIAPAQADFSAALEIDPALGNAWLGRGLAYFQAGEPSSAVEAILLAAAVEPNRAFFRSYLGKALAEVDRRERADNELKLAVRLDPDDPTPWLYRAILDQRGYAYNQAVEHLEQSIARNDNRAVYRSGFLLDRDRSLREANLAAVYQNVGMTEPSLEAARRSVVADYLNPSAHLFLSNSINALRDPRRASLRYETPWFNELLLANLFAPAGSELLPLNISQQEYTALFPVKSYDLSARTRYRSDGEWLATGTLRQSFARSSVALDYGIFTTNGSRPNAEAERFTGYLQVKHALSEKDSLYLNLKFQKFEGGDLRQLYDEDDYDPDYRVEQKQKPVVIAGYQHQWSPQNRSLALGGVLTDDLHIENPNASFLTAFIDPNNPVLGGTFSLPADTEQERETEVYFGELQQIFSDERQTLLFGARFDIGSFPTENTFEAVGFPIFPGEPFTLRSDPAYERFVGYAYYTRELLRKLWATAGIAYEWQEYPVNSSIVPASERRDSSSELLPKAGLIWTPDERLTLRAGYARSVGGATFDESVRLEPTQVAGFTQSFRTLINESEVGGLVAPLFDTLGASAIVSLPSRTYFGAEAFWRRAQSERGIGLISVSTLTNQFDQVRVLSESLDYAEYGGSVFLNQLIGEQFAVGLRYSYIQAELERRTRSFDGAALTGFSADQSSDLHTAEAYAIWNHPDGWFAKAEARAYEQSNGGYGGTRPGDSWFQGDVSVGRRFFDNRGALEIGVLNLTDEDPAFNPLLTLPDLPRERVLFVELRVDW